MKKTVAILLSMILALPFAFAGVLVGDRVTTYDEGDVLVGESGYADISNWNTNPDVYVCATNEGVVKEYGMNLQNDAQKSRARDLVESLAKMSFAGFDHYGCLRARI